MSLAHTPTLLGWRWRAAAGRAAAYGLLFMYNICVCRERERERERERDVCLCADVYIRIYMYIHTYIRMSLAHTDTPHVSRTALAGCCGACCRVPSTWRWAACSTWEPTPSRRGSWAAAAEGHSGWYPNSFEGHDGRVGRVDFVWVVPFHPLRVLRPRAPSTRRG